MHLEVRKRDVDTVARLSSKGQVTVPKAVREALGVAEGDELVFHVEGNRAIVARTPDFLGLAGSVPVPAAKRNAAWDDVIRRTRAVRAGREQ
jgi:antitoxin PrlF